MSSAARKIFVSRRMPRCALLTFGVLVLLVCAGSPRASADPPAVPAMENGGFRAIKGPSDPEEYFWVVDMSENQELRQVDDRTAAVYYADNDHVAFTISAGAAHDAEGTAVPTSLVVSGTNVLTRTVHHRAGNPAAEGAPFVYPVIDGVGWEGGFHTEYVDIPDEPKPDSSVEPPLPASSPASRAGRCRRIVRG